MQFFDGKYMEFAVYIVAGNFLLSKKQWQKDRFYPKAVAVALIVLLFAFLLPAPTFGGLSRIGFEMLMHILILAVSVAAGRLSYTASLRDGLLTVFGSVTVLSVKNFTVGILKILVLDSVWSEELNTVLSLMFYVAFALLQMRFMKKRPAPLKSNKPYVIFASVCITAALCGTGVKMGYDTSNPAYAPYFIFIYCAYTIVELLCVSLVVIFRREEALYDDNTVLNSLLENQRQQYELAKQSVEAINLKYHDLKHLVNMLKESGGVFPMEELQIIEKSIADYGAMLKTGNDALDVVLAEKTLLARKQGASITCIADGSALHFMSKADIYVLFGNILENAMEAVAKIPQEESRVIALSVSRDMGVVRIRAKNRRPAEDIVLEDGLPTTTKEHAEYHGFGTRSIKVLAEKYGGAINIAVNEEYYTLNIVLPGE